MSLRKETHGFLLTASNPVLPAAPTSLAWHLMKGEFDELCKWPLDREGCRKTRLWGRCSFESPSALSLAHIRTGITGSGWKAQCTRLPAGQAFCGVESSEKGYGEGEPASHVCLSQSLLGLLYLKANSCLFCLNVVFFLKVLAICLAFSHPCWDLRSSPHFTT